MLVVYGVLHLDYKMSTFVFYFYLSCLNSLSFLNLKANVFHQFWKVLRHYYLNLTLFSLSTISLTHMVDLTLSSMSFKLS